MIQVSLKAVFQKPESQLHEAEAGFAFLPMSDLPLFESVGQGSCIKPWVFSFYEHLVLDTNQADCKAT